MTLPPAVRRRSASRWVLPAAGGGVLLWVAGVGFAWGSGGMGLLFQALGAATVAGGAVQFLRCRARRAEARAEEELSRIFDLLPVGAAHLDARGRVLRCNRKGLELLGMDAGSARDMELVAPRRPVLQLDGNPIDPEALPVAQALATGARTEAVLGFERPSGEDFVWLEVRVDPRLDPEGRVVDLVVAFGDVTQRKTTEAELAIQSFRDRLTGLPNKALFLERLAQAIARAGRRKQVMGLLYLDLDRFKMVNDTLGHAAGDQLLVQVARRLRACLRPEDGVARLGGDEFVVTFEDLPSAEEGLIVAERVNSAFKPPFLLDGQDLYSTCSLGLVFADSAACTPAELLRDAEVAMYRAKSKGEGSIEVFDPSMNAQAAARFQMERELRQALERREFTLHYQPIVSLATGRIEGFEALVRWQHPERGMVSPLDFVPLAEETGLIVPLGAWVLEEAVARSAEWARRFPADPARIISVNVSGRQFQQRDLIPTITRVLEAARLEPASLKLEITESVMMRDPHSSLEAMKTLKRLQVHLSIDDFGTGYSSLSYLKRFPVDTLKVDKSFVDGLGRDPESTAIVQAVLSMAKAMGLRVTAEGIETPDQLAQLRALGCDQGQGYFFSRPLPAHEAETLLGKNPSW